ncbi:MAG: metal transporter [Acidobacteria bacterium]|nr:metal transporter [Acidobacteriota bacterium]
MKKLFLAGLLTVAVSAPAAAEPADELAAPYLHIQVALANDSVDGVAAAAASISAAAAALGAAGAAIAASAQALAAAQDLRTARAVFGPLSDAFIAYGEEVGYGELRVAYCPMVDKSWVQAAGGIRNPFYGSQMLTCGEFTK